MLTEPLVVARLQPVSVLFVSLVPGCHADRNVDAA